MKVMIAIDGSECSKAAVEFVTRRPWSEEDSFLVAHVVEPIPVDVGIAYVPAAYSQADGAAFEQAEALLKIVADELRAALPGHGVDTKVVFGTVTSELVDLAKEAAVDLIVMGSHGRKGFNRLFLGSVAEEVLKHAPCSVEIVKGAHHAVSGSGSASASQA
jgi:nucleotide-binding universal stress UspA family protein